MTVKKSSKRTSNKKVVVVEQRKTKQKKPRSRPRKTRLGMIGKIAGGFWGPHGADLGRAAGNMISKITGMGDYRINSNSISNGNSIPTFQSSTDGMRVCHREFLTDIVGSINFVNRSWPINPGLVSTFPFLSRLAANFEEYDLKGLVFEYRPSSGTAISSTSSALGVVVMATNYDSTDPLFPTKQAMESYEFANSTLPFKGCIHPVECARNRNVLESLYLRTGPQPPNTDLRMFDLGLFQLSTSGMQSAYTVGELWVSYDALLRKPRLNNSIPGNVWHATTGPNQWSGTSGQLLGPTPFVDKTDDLMVVLVQQNPLTLLLPYPGYYLISILGKTEFGNFASGMTTTRGANLTAVNLLSGRGASSGGNAGSGTPVKNYDEAVQVLTQGTSSANWYTIVDHMTDNMSWDVTISRIPYLTPNLQVVQRLGGDRFPDASRRFSFASFDSAFQHIEEDEEKQTR